VDASKKSLLSTPIKGEKGKGGSIRKPPQREIEELAGTGKTRYIPLHWGEGKKKKDVSVSWGIETVAVNNKKIRFFKL